MFSFRVKLTLQALGVQQIQKCIRASGFSKSVVVQVDYPITSLIL